MAPGERDDNLVEVHVWQMAMDENSRIPVVILREKDGGGKLPIWIGTSEATAITTRIQNKEFSRPMTHDLLMAVIRAVDVHVRRIEIASLRDSTYYARVVLQREHELFAVDARPSDSIAIALRAEAPIFAAKELLSHQLDQILPDSMGNEPYPEPPPSSEDAADRLRRRIEDIKPEDFGRFSF